MASLPCPYRAALRSALGYYALPFQGGFWQTTHFIIMEKERSPRVNDVQNRYNPGIALRSIPGSLIFSLHSVRVFEVGSTPRVESTFFSVILG